MLITRTAVSATEPRRFRQLFNACANEPKQFLAPRTTRSFSISIEMVGWHSDHESGLGDCPTIASLSLGATRRFQFRHRRTKETIPLELSEGLWLVMAGKTQRFWVHQVPKTTAAVERRINLTFRHMSQQP
jgi:hypothetical protein